VTLPTAYRGYRSVPDDNVPQSYVDAALALLVGAAPGTLDTLKEIADALGNDPNYATTLTTALAGKANSASVGFLFTAGATAPQDKIASFGAAGLQRQNRPTFSVDGAAPSAGQAVPAALGAFGGTLLSDALTALGTLYTRTDLLAGLVRKLVERDQSLGIAL
jgi:hypothetical protein